MAMSSIRSGGDEDEDGLDTAPMSEINVTPMVDVMLVLLIIFMVAAPLMTTGVPVQLPKTAAAKVGQAKKPLEVTIDKDGQPSIAKEIFTPETLTPRLREIAAEDPSQVVLVRGDRDVPYGRIMEVMGLVGQAGFSKVSLIAQSPGGPAPSAAACMMPGPAPVTTNQPRAASAAARSTGCASNSSTARSATISANCRSICAYPTCSAISSSAR